MTPPPPPCRRTPAWLRRGGLLLVAALVLEYVVVPQVAGARSAMSVLSQVTPAFLAIAVGLEAASLACYSALTRCLIAPYCRPPLWTCCGSI
jgi:uncharacterized membrane protein YbhN (UPF0104 family)